MTTTHDDRTFIYQIDSDDVITFANQAWWDFAAENEAPHLTPETVLNRPLWHFITDKQTEYLYRLAVEKVRFEQRQLVIPFQCDSPDCRRSMEMIVLPRPQAAIQFESRVLKLEYRPPVELLQPATPRSDDSVRICGWCKKIWDFKTGRWIEVGALSRPSKASVKAPRLSHITCFPCYETVFRQLI